MKDRVSGGIGGLPWDTSVSEELQSCHDRLCGDGPNIGFECKVMQNVTPSFVSGEKVFSILDQYV